MSIKKDVYYISFGYVNSNVVVEAKIDGVPNAVTSKSGS